MNVFLVHPLRSHSIGHLAVGADCFVVVLKQLPFLSHCSRLPVSLPLAYLVFIAQYSYLYPIHYREIDASPMHICKQGAAKLLIAQGNPFKAGCAIEEGIAQIGSL